MWRVLRAQGGVLLSWFLWESTQHTPIQRAHEHSAFPRCDVRGLKPRRAGDIQGIGALLRGGGRLLLNAQKGQ